MNGHLSTCAVLRAEAECSCGYDPFGELTEDDLHAMLRAAMTEPEEEDDDPVS